MKKHGFLSRLKEEEKLELIDPSEQIKESYLEKSTHSLKASQLLTKSDLPEEAISMAYYAMYHCLLALMFNTGIKCENHTGNILLLKDLFDKEDLKKTISQAKEERIDKQYYTDFDVTKKDAEDLITKAQKFITEIKLLIESQTQYDIERIRKSFESL